MEIKLKNIAKRYSGNVEYTLENINLDIKSKEFIVLLGPSGCGKTTLLRMIAGLNSITKGELYFGERKVNNIEPKDRDLAMVFQSYALYPHLTVYKNMAYSLKVRKIKKDIIDQRVKSVAKILEIEHLLYSKPSEISGGQRQRVALGRAIVRKPSIFLMDEPLSNLDAKLRESMRVELVKIHRLVNATTIYVTHDQLEAMTMADKIVLFNNKVIQQMGKPTELYNKPNNLFVANFIGSPSMNFIEIEKQKNKIYIKSTTQEINLLRTKINNDILKKDGIILGVRAEHLTISEKKVRGSIMAEVIMCESLGKETIVSAQYSFDNFLKIIIPSQLTYKLGKNIYIRINEKTLNIFNKKTTNRIN